MRLYSFKAFNKTLYLVGDIPPSMYDKVIDAIKSTKLWVAAYDDYNNFKEILKEKLEELYIHVEIAELYKNFEEV